MIPHASSSKSFPKGRRNFALKLGKTEQADVNIHTSNFATTPGVLGTLIPWAFHFQRDMLSKSENVANVLSSWGGPWRSVLEVGVQCMHPDNMPLLSTIPAQPEGAVAFFRAVQFLFILRWFSERQELSCLRRIIRRWRTITLYYPQSDKSLLEEEVHNNSRHA